MSFVKEKSFQCNECDKKFHQQSQLIVHIRHHTGEKPFVCNYCSKGFASVKVLKVHERVHTGERPYKCPYCDKSFSAYANLVVHRRIHTNEKPYICKLCCRGFEHSGNLSRHFRAHMVDTGFRCILCGKIFELEQDLQEHTKSDHPNEYETYISTDKSKQDRLPLSESKDVQYPDKSALCDSVEENSTINFNGINRPKERLISKINKKEMRIVTSSSSPCKLTSPSKENTSVFCKNSYQEETCQFPVSSDCNLSPVTDTSSISDSSEKSWKSELDDQENQCQLNVALSKHLKKKKSKDYHSNSLTDNERYLNFNSCSIDSSSNFERSLKSSVYDSTLDSSVDQYSMPAMSRNLTKDQESPYHYSTGNPFDDCKRRKESYRTVNHSDTRSSPCPDRLLPHNELPNLSQSNSNNYFPAPPPLIPIEEIDQNCETQHTDIPILEPYPMDSYRNENSLSSVLQDCDLYAASVKNEDVKPDSNYMSNVKEIIQKSLRQYITPEMQKDIFKRKVERALCTLVGKCVMQHFGYPERTCEQVLICILDMAHRTPCADVRVNEIDRMKINMMKLIECSFPNKNSWDHLGWRGKPIEFILDKIQGQERPPSKGIEYVDSSTCLPSSSNSIDDDAFEDERDTKREIKSEVDQIFKRELN